MLPASSFVLLMIPIGIGGRDRNGTAGLSVADTHFFLRYRFLDTNDTFGSRLAIIDHFISWFHDVVV